MSIRRPLTVAALAALLVGFLVWRGSWGPEQWSGPRVTAPPESRTDVHAGARDDDAARGEVRDSGE